MVLRSERDAGRSEPARLSRGEQNGHRQQGHDRSGEEPPRVESVVRGQVDGRNDDHDARGDPPVVTDDEVVPEAGEIPQERHASTTCGSEAGTVRRSTSTSTNAVAMTNAIRTRIARSAPGHSTPAPSPDQKIPNDVSMIPTPNFSVFSGTRLSGA